MTIKINNTKILEDVKPLPVQAQDCRCKVKNKSEFKYNETYYKEILLYINKSNFYFLLKAVVLY